MAHRTKPVAAFVVLSAVGTLVLPAGVDWGETFYPASREILAWHSPYLVPTFLNAPWALLPFLPLGLFPEQLARGMAFAMGAMAFAYAGYRLGAKPLALGAFLVSPPVLHCLLNSNIDWMPVLGMVLPPQIGLFLLATKPQMGAVVGLWWLVESWRKGGWREVMRVFAPVSIAFGMSILTYGLWPLRMGPQTGLWWNASLWPASIPVGLVLLVVALRQRRATLAMAAAPCLSPYVLLHSWSGALAALLPAQAETLVAVAGLWIVVILRS